MGTRIVIPEKRYVHCDYCTKKFKAKPVSIQNNVHHFCNNECKVKYQRKYPKKFNPSGKRSLRIRCPDGTLRTYSDYKKLITNNCE